MKKSYWSCHDCPYETRNEDEALKHSIKVHPTSHSLELVD